MSNVICIQCAGPYTLGCCVAEHAAQDTTKLKSVFQEVMEATDEDDDYILDLEEMDWDA